MAHVRVDEFVDLLKEPNAATLAGEVADATQSFRFACVAGVDEVASLPNHSPALGVFARPSFGCSPDVSQPEADSKRSPR